VWNKYNFANAQAQATNASLNQSNGFMQTTPHKHAETSQCLLLPKNVKNIQLNGYLFLIDFDTKRIHTSLLWR